MVPLHPGSGKSVIFSDRKSGNYSHGNWLSPADRVCILRLIFLNSTQHTFL